MSKRLVLLSALLGVLLNLGLMLLPSVLLGVPQLALVDRRLASFLMMISFWVILEAIGSNRLHFHTVKAQARWLPYLMSAVMFAVFMASLSESALNGVTAFNILATIGGVLMLIGVLLRQLSTRELGNYFLDDVAVVAGQTLVTTGIYSQLRHPSETGNLCIAFGSSLLLGSLIGLLLCLFLLLPIVLFRIQLEDRLLMRHYPDEFRDYKHNVPALIPWRRMAIR